MLSITIPGSEYWDSANEIFLYDEPVTLYLEHSLLAISEWEAKWHKSFIFSEDKTDDEILDYIRCMSNDPVDASVLARLTTQNYKDINDYINDSHTATKFFTKPSCSNTSDEVITSEVIYFWMSAYGIPFECERWNLNRLLTLIQVCNLKNKKPEKMKPQDVHNMYAELNAKRRKEWNTKG